MKISIIVPAYNEEFAIRSTVERLKLAVKSVDHEIIVVDDGSSDKTYDVAKNLAGIRLLRHETNKGKAAALETGFSNASGDILFTIDADCTYPPEVIPEVAKLMEKEGLDMVICSRFLGGNPQMSRLNYFGNILFSLLVTVLTGKRVTDASSGMRGLRKRVWTLIKVKSRNLDWEVEMTTRALRKGFVVKEFPIQYFDRVGASKLRPVRDGFRFLKAIIVGRFF